MKSNLVIVEVSQKQAYIFSGRKLRDNVMNSAVIAYVTSSDFFEACAGKMYQREKNEVYCGGGHAVLEFAVRETAKQFIHLITGEVIRHYPGLELFAKIYECEGEPGAESITKLRAALERKKSLRRASFSQGTFGVEKIDASSRQAEALGPDGRALRAPTPPDFDHSDSALYPDRYARTFSFEDLGGSRGNSNFIAVVHIDGNGMGKRLEELAKAGAEDSWEMYRGKLKRFSDCVAEDFKEAFKEMCTCVAGNIIEGKIGEITLKKGKDKEPCFPVRRIITEGDDICFVTEGRIGLECARIFLEIVNKKKNGVDGQNYPACAGVAVVHQKYPFYRAYELAEMLCSNAKKYAANAVKELGGVGITDLCAMDWHLEFGEMEDGMDNIRDDYLTDDGKQMELRPYAVCGCDAVMQQEKVRNYKNFRAVMEVVGSKANAYARGKLKGLRSVIRKGETAAWNYLKANRIEGIALDCYTGVYENLDLGRIGTGKGQEKSLFVQTADGKERSVLFDAIEMSDTFIPLQD